jgi:alpha-glucuronidase
VTTGTGYIGQYRPPVSAKFESLDSCPEDLLLFMHHVPYTHRLRSGDTLIQQFYDLHYQGADEARALVDQWRMLEHHIDEQRYHEVLERLEFQAGHAQVWRDSICRWFMKRSSIPDEKGRVGNYPNRVEAEDQQLDGYEFTEIEPWEAASGRGAAQLAGNVETGSVRFKYRGEPGTRDVRVQYFDEEDGVSKFKLFVAGKQIDQWKADNHVPTPTTLPDAHSSSCRMIRGVPLKPGDEIRIEGTADGGERAAIDYIEFAPNLGQGPQN